MRLRSPKRPFRATNESQGAPKTPKITPEALKIRPKCCPEPPRRPAEKRKEKIAPHPSENASQT